MGNLEQPVIQEVELILFFLADVKLTSKFLGGTKGFDAILPEAAECRMAGFCRTRINF